MSGGAGGTTRRLSRPRTLQQKSEMAELFRLIADER